MSDYAPDLENYMARSKLTQSEGFALVQSWQSSGQRQLTYCREHDVAVHLLQYWRKRSATHGCSDSIEIVPVKRAVTTGSIVFSRASDGEIQLSVSGTFDPHTCRAALEVLP